MIQKKTNNTVVHLKVDEAMEGRRQVAQGNEEQEGGEPPSLLSVRSTANAKAPQTLQVHVRPNTIQELRLQSQRDR